MKPNFLKPVQQRIFSAEECNKIIDCESYPITESFAENQPVDGIDNSGDNKWIWDRIENALLKINKRHYGFTEPKIYHSIGKKTYKTGDSYLYHQDNLSLRRLTAVIFLNNDYTGGDLRVFCGKEVVMKNNIGVLAVFPSWYFHQADEVLSGERKVLITFLTGPYYNFYETK
jgi:predicted 2-oxoglutarate/Fe(II)-dependent dioxygenase YbiX